MNQCSFGYEHHPFRLNLVPVEHVSEEKKYPGRDSASFDALGVQLVSSMMIDIKPASDITPVSGGGDILVPCRLANQKPRNNVTLPFFF